MGHRLRATVHGPRIKKISKEIESEMPHPDRPADDRHLSSAETFGRPLK